ncbi:Spermidine/putrescine-binding periplasmic protein [Pediococcus pentosaceus]|nr:Spermidine/putrescine-binding periplasmic protein [Pediococcus pentosaceus]
MKKRNLMVVIMATAFLFTGCGQKAGQSKKITVSTFGISTKEMKNDVVSPFEKLDNLDVKTQSGDSAARYTQIAHNPNNSIDVVELSQNNALSGNKKGLFQKINFNKLKNFKTLSHNQQKLAKETNSIPYTVNSMGIIYNSKKVGKITSWDQLWDKKFKGKIAIPDITTTFGPAMLYVASDHAKTDISKDNGKAGLKAMKELKPNVAKTYTQSSDLANMFKNGEIDVAVVGDFAVSMIQNSTPNMEYTVPTSGTYANYDTISIVKNSKNLNNDYKYIDYRLSEKTQTRAASTKSLNNAPVNNNVKLTSKDAKNKTYGDIAKRAKTIDFEYVNSQLKNWITEWNKIMNK